MSLCDKEPPRVEEYDRYNKRIKTKDAIVDYLKNAKAHLLDAHYVDTISVRTKSERRLEFYVITLALSTFNISISDVIAPNWRDGLQIRQR